MVEDSPVEDDCLQGILLYNYGTGNPLGVKNCLIRIQRKERNVLKDGSKNILRELKNSMKNQGRNAENMFCLIEENTQRDLFAKGNKLCLCEEGVMKEECK